MPEPSLYLHSMGTAAVVSAVFVVVMAGVGRQASSTRLNSACVVGMGLGLAAGCHALSWQLVWPPVQGLDRFLTIVVPLVLGIELIAGFPSVPRWIACLLRMSLAVTIPRILLHDSVYLSGSRSDKPVWQIGAELAACGALPAGAWSLLGRLSQRSPGVSIPMALGMTTLCAGLTVMMAGYIKGGAAAFPLAATLAATALVSRLVAKSTSLPAIVGVGVVGLFSLTFIGHFFGRLSTGRALVLLLAPLLCWVTEAPLLRHRKPWIVGSLRLVLVAIPLAAVLAVAKRDFNRGMAPLLGTDTGVRIPSSRPDLHFSSDR